MFLVIRTDQKSHQHNGATEIVCSKKNSGSRLYEGFGLFGNEPTIQPGHGICCGIRSFKAFTDFGYAIKVESQVLLQKSKPSKPNMTKKKLKAVKPLRLKKDIRIFQVDKGNYKAVLHKSK
jgi:hypothetical protein